MHRASYHSLNIDLGPGRGSNDYDEGHVIASFLS
jgi:hypothetical protein